MEVVGAGLQGGAQDRAPRPSVLRAEGAGEDLDLGDGVHGRLHDVGGAAQEVDVARVVVDAVEQVVVLARPRAVGRELQGSTGPLLRAGGTRAQASESGVVPAVQGQVLDGDRRDGVAHLAAPGLEQRDLGRHLHRLLELSRLQGDVHHRLLLEVQLDAAADRLLEALRLHLEPVGADPDRSEDVGAVLPAHPRQGERLAFVGEGDLRAGDDGPRRVLDRAQDGPGVHLGPGGRAQQQQGERHQCDRFESSRTRTHRRSPWPNDLGGSVHHRIDLAG